jgi:molybdopterin-containing oxidoreductase family molybdopterin binding subunit
MSEAEEIWDKFGLSGYEAALIYASNALMTSNDPEMMMDRFRGMFVAQFSITPSETSEGVADIIFPDTSVLEFTDYTEGEGYFFNYPMGMMDWEYHIRQKAVEPIYERRFVGDVMLDLAEGIGIREAYMGALMGYLSLTGCPAPWDPKEKLTWEEISDRVVQARFGPEHNLEWFKEHGFLRWPKKVEEAYWRWFSEGRSSIYPEWLVEYGEELKEICQPRGLELDWSQFTPLISYFPPIIYDKDLYSEYDMLVFGYRDILHGASGTQDLPWLFEASEMNPFTFNVCINRSTAEKKGYKEGDWIYLENRLGKRIKVQVHLIEGIHPQTIGIVCGTGHWLEGHPCCGKGGHLNTILESDMAHHEPIGMSIETAVRVKVYKAED